MKQWVAKLKPNNVFARSVVVLMGGTAFAQAVVVLASPVLTRLYSPEAFGSLSVFTSIVTIATIFSTLQLHLAIPLSQDREEALDVVLLAFGILVLFTGLFGAVTVWGGSWGEILRLPFWGNRTFWTLISATILLTGVHEIVSYWAIRSQAFGLVSRSRVYQNIGSVAAQLAMSRLSSFGLVLGFACSRLVGIYAMGSRVLKDFRGYSLEFQRLLHRLKQYRQFPLFTTWLELIDALSLHSLPLILTPVFGPSVVGFYALAERVIAMPVVLVGRATAEVFASSAAAEYRKGMLENYLVAVHQYLMNIYGVPFAVAFLGLPFGFKVVFGEAWLLAGVIGQLLIPWLFARSLANPTAFVWKVINRQDLALRLSSVALAVRIGGLLVGTYLNSATLAIGLYSGGGGGNSMATRPAVSNLRCFTFDASWSRVEWGCQDVLPDRCRVVSGELSRNLCVCRIHSLPCGVCRYDYD